MKVKDMNAIQMKEMTMRWDIEYEQSYLDSIHNGNIHYFQGTTELEMLREYDEIIQRIHEAQHRYDEFMTANAKWFI